LGFFSVINSSISEADIERARTVAREFFHLPAVRKSEYPLTFSGGELFGYAALGAETADVANVSLTGEESPPDLMESFQVADVARVENKFPLEAMKIELEAMYKKKQDTAQQILTLIAESLDLAPDFFTKEHFSGKHRSILRVTRYPALTTCTSAGGAGVSRISPHQDIGSITLLSQDHCGGLEVFDRKACSTTAGAGAGEGEGGGEWLPVQPEAGSMIVNVGNLLMRWTNYTYRSSVHRVISTPNSDDEERISVIFFANPNDDTIVDPVPSTVSECNPAKFESHTVDAYLSCKFTQLFDPEAREQKGACRFDD
jgi:isopenicillin N synthase-like dioxygenase